ncbi:MAG: tetratricopeptide repeat protein [Phycisphaerales bacterium]|nr:MAG: tetratricopeptide repeat protein [Phycisphaerales bacterium]
MRKPRKSIAALASVFLLALSVRFGYLHQIRDIGFFAQPVSDGLIYDQRAQGIAAGNWLGPADFVHAPLYAYFMGVIYAVFGRSLLAVRVVQIVLGAGACVLVMLAARRFFDRRTAVAAGIILALYPPAVFFDGLIQKTSLSLFLSALLLWLLALCRERATWWRWGLAGLVMGLLVLTRQNAMLLAPLLLVWLWIEFRRAAVARRRAWTGAAVIGSAVVMLPWAVRNKAVTGEFVLTTPNMGQNFAMGNHPQATGTYLPFKRGRSTAEYEQGEWVREAERATGRSMSAREVSDHYFDAATEWIRNDPGAWVRLMGKKTLMVFGAYEAPDTEDYYLYTERSWLLRWLDTCLHFGVLGPVAVMGIVLTWSRRREQWLLYGWLFVTAVAVAAFVVFARYRFPLIPVAVMFAAAGVVEAAALIRRLEGRRLAGPAAALVAAVVVMNWPVHHPRRTNPTSYTNHGAALAAQGRYEDDLRELDRAFALDPDNIDAHLAAGNTLVQLGRFEEAMRHYEEARQGDPDYGGAYRGLGNALTGLGRLDEAAAQYRHALDLDSRDARALCGLATATARQGRFEEAIELFDRAVQIDAAYPEAYLNLGNTYLSEGRLEQAAAAYEQALRHRPDFADALYNLGVVQWRLRRSSRAIPLLRQALEFKPDHRDARAALVTALAQAQRWDEAIQCARKLPPDDPSRTEMQRLLEATQAGNVKPD